MAAAASTTTERRGIPAAAFVEDVRAFLEKSGCDASTAIGSLQDRLQQYKLAEVKLLTQRRDLQIKLPDLKKCLDIVEALISKKSASETMTVDFELAEGIYSQACIDDGNSVYLWLGANVMLEYSYDEAHTLLKKNLENASSSLEVLIEDMQFLRDQVTITEVTIARVYNWDVHNRRKQKQVKKDDESLD